MTHLLSKHPLSANLAKLYANPWASWGRALTIGLLGLQLSAISVPAWSQTEGEIRRGASVTLNFMNADIDSVARAVATLTGRNVVVDPRVKGSVNLISTNPVTPGEAVNMFTQQLRTQGFALVHSNGLYTVVPEADGKLQSSSVSEGGVRGGGSQIVTQIFKLNHETAANLVPVLRPLISPNNTINVSPSSNALIITDYANNLQRIARIIGSLDAGNTNHVEIIRLKHAVASDLLPLVSRLMDGSLASGSTNPSSPTGIGSAQNTATSLGGGTGPSTSLVADPRSNALILRAANPAKLAQLRDLVAKLDQPADNSTHGGLMGGNIHVVHLKNADATKLAVTLRAALAALPGTNTSASSMGSSAVSTGNANIGGLTQGNTGGGSGSSSVNTGPTINAAANNQPSTGGQIQADPSTNSIIISAPEPVYRQLRAVIDRLDERRAQVYIEALVAEVNDELDSELGVQWQAVINNAVTLGTNFNAGTSTNLISLLGAAAAYGANSGGNSLTNLGSVLPGAGGNLLGGGSFGNGNMLGVLANFLQTSGAGNVLSRPTLLTLDNEEARIVVGQNVPFVTGSYTNNNSGGNSGSVNPFQTYERQDVGLTLRVRPQISADGTVKMVIYQEASSLQSGTTASGYVTNKRSIESSVLVEDGAIVALGGLMQDSYAEKEDKVPLLGDVPVFGNLFKSRSRAGVKSNLMIFLRPVVLRDARQTNEFSHDRYQEMQSHQRVLQPSSSVALPVNRAPVLPDLPHPKSSVLPLPPQSSSKLVVDPTNSVTPSREAVALPPAQPALSHEPPERGFNPRTSGQTGPAHSRGWATSSDHYDPSLYEN